MRDSYTFLQPEQSPLQAENGAERADDRPAGPTPAASPFGLAARQDFGGPRPLRGSRAPVPMLVYRLSDTMALLFSLLVALVVTNLGEMPYGIEPFLAIRISLKNLILVVGLLLVWRAVCTLWGLYDWGRIRSRLGEFIRVVAACVTAAPYTLAFPAASVSGAFDYLTLGVFWMMTALVILTPRTLLHYLAVSRRRPKSTVLIAGSGPRAIEVERRLEEDSDVAYRVVGFVDNSLHPVSPALEGRLVSSLDHIESVLMHHPIDEVVIALPLKSHYGAVERLVRSCESLGIQVTLPADPLRSSRSNFRPSRSTSFFAVTLGEAPDGVRLLVKRCLDVVGASTALVLFGPLMLLTAIAIKVTSPGPVLFAQERYGYHRRRFQMYKFRTMVHDAEAMQPALEALNEAPGPLFKIREDPRITLLGAFLRRSSIDELPQLFNVLRGEMSLVGPRPMAVRDVLRFTETTLTRRFSVHPGLTGLWQVEGRSSLPYESWVALDLRYAEQWSLGLDLKILLRTLPVVLRGTGAQ